NAHTCLEKVPFGVLAEIAAQVGENSGMGDLDVVVVPVAVPIDAKHGKRPAFGQILGHLTARLAARHASARTAIEDHAAVADEALGVRPHAIALQRAAPAVESMKDGVDRRQATDAAAILVGRDAVEERLRVALLHRLEHLAVFGLDPRALGPGDRAW